MVTTHLIRPFLRWLPFQFGKGKLAHYLLQPAEIPTMDVCTKSGVVIRTAQDKVYRDIYLYGEYEHNLTSHIKKIVKPGFVCLDIGANFGYYSVLLAKLTRAKMAVHAFEPVPFIYKLAQETVKQNGVEDCIVLNNRGLGATCGEFIVYSFSHLPHGHASSNDLGRADAVAHRCKVATLDEYADKYGLRTVDFIKADVEGDELSAFRGGERLLRRSKATIAFEVNMSCLTARSLEPKAVEDFLRSCGYTEFLQVPPHRPAHKVPHLASQAGCDYIASKAH
jgi:FkbM family methyltransferase